MARICLFDQRFLLKIDIYHCLNYFYLIHAKLKTKTKQLSGLIKISPQQIQRKWASPYESQVKFQKAAITCQEKDDRQKATITCQEKDDRQAAGGK